MPPRDIALAVLVAAIWGFAFVATELALESFSPPQLTAIRFLVACLPALVLPHPPIPWGRLVVIGLFLFAAQFLLLFFGFVHGMPPGLASVTMQTQAFFTILIAAVVFSELPTVRQATGIAVAFCGLLLIGLSVGGELTYLGLVLTLGGALSWAVGNVMVKGLQRVDMLALVVWLSLVPPLPALALSALVDDTRPLAAAVADASWTGWAAALYLGLVATVFAYALWGRLLRRYPAPVVAPFALLAPGTGIASSALVFGERFGPLRTLGMALILLGLAIVVVTPRFVRPLGRVSRRD